MQVKTSESSFVLNEGDLAAINANTLHFASASPEGTLCSLVFSPLLITGNQESAFSTKYIQPLLSCRAFTDCQINSADKEMISAWFKTAFEAIANDSCGFEFTVRENLSRICFYLYKKFEPLMDAKTAALDHNNLRIRKMLDYIHKNFADNISLPDISGAADISERECLRCFKKNAPGFSCTVFIKIPDHAGCGVAALRSFQQYFRNCLRLRFRQSKQFRKNIQTFLPMYSTGIQKQQYEKEGKKVMSSSFQSREKTGYLNEDFRLFHIKDQTPKEYKYHYHDFHK